MARNHKIQIRRDTAANWTSTDPILAAGELALETDTGRVKAGDGSTAWSSLDPINIDTYATATRLWLPRTTTNFVSAPDAAALDISGDLDLRFYGAADDWTAAGNQALIAKSVSGDRGYRWYFNTSGIMIFGVSADGSAETLAVCDDAIPTSDGVEVGLRVTWRASDGRVQFFTSDDDGASWTQLGADETANVGSIHNSAQALRVGQTDSTNWPYGGTIKRAQVLSGIDGTVVAELDGTVPSAPRFLDAYSNVWTFNGTAYAWRLSA